ncbi:hypothetical protein CHUAL_001867 [Chamberlinius hualienensis]
MERPFRFCLLLILGMAIPIGFLLTPLYIRHHVYGKYHIPVSSTETRLLDHKISTVWCESEKIAINTTFNAYLMSDLPQFENSTRTYWTTKHYNLRAEEREYWGFYLPKGSSLSVSLCARYDGGKVVIFKGKRNMKKCARREEDDEPDDEHELSDEDDDYLTDDDLEDTEEEDSSVSSSEEEFTNECHGAMFNQTLIPTTHCESITKWQPKNVVSYRVTTSDYYYVLVTSLNSLFQNTIVSNITLTKPIYNLTTPVTVCQNVTECTLSFSFGSWQKVILEMPEEQDWQTYVAEVECQPRAMLYFPFYLAIPISILCFAFKGKK